MLLLRDSKAYISPISPLYLPYISHISPLCGSKACRIVAEGLHRLGSPQEVQPCSPAAPPPHTPHAARRTPRQARTLCTHPTRPCTHPARCTQACDRLVETVLRSAKCTDNVSVVLVMLDWVPDGE